MQNEEYLLEVDADLIRRRVDYEGFAANELDQDVTDADFDWSQPLPSFYRKKRSADPSPIFEDVGSQARFFNITKTGFGKKY